MVELVRYIWDMSADTAKENASFVDSSATQKQDAVNLEDPVLPIHIASRLMLVVPFTF